MHIAIAKMWIYQQVTADPVITAYVPPDRITDDVTQATAYPILQYTSVDPVPISRGIGGAILGADGLYLVKLILASKSNTPALPAYNQIKARLHNGFGQTSQGIVLSSQLEQEINYGELVSGVQYRHLGAIFRIYTQEMQ